MKYQVESWSDCKDEMALLWPLHWEEVGEDKDKVKLNMWCDVYQDLQENDRLHIVTARVDGIMVGYHISTINHHLHFADTLMAHTDLFYLHPKYRVWFNGINLFKFVEKTLKARGVQKMHTSSKVKLDMSRIFERLNWQKSEIVYTKYIGD